MSEHPKTGQFRYGIIEEVDASRARVRVRLPEQSDLVTGWLPVAQAGSLKDRHYGMPQKGSQVALLTDRHCEDGVCLGAIYSDPDPIPEGADAEQFGTWFEDGTLIRYHKGEHGLLVDLSACQGALTIKCQSARVEATDLTAQVTTLTATATTLTATAGGASLSIGAAGLALAAPAITLTGTTTIVGDIQL
jgi:phage baseplate assembly protein V